MHCVMIGAGGIGFYLGPMLARLLAFTHSGAKIVPQLTIIDGDIIETNNLARVFSGDVLGQDKADVLADICLRQVGPGTLTVTSIAQYLDPDTIKGVHRHWYKDDIVIFGCVDNNRSRAYLEDLCMGLRNATLISGGNSFDEGQVHFFARRNGRNVTAPIREFAGDIYSDTSAEAEFPSRRSCDQEYESAPQLVLANSVVANMMATTWWAHCRPGVQPNSKSSNEIIVKLNSIDVAPFVREPAAHRIAT